MSSTRYFENYVSYFVQNRYAGYFIATSDKKRSKIIRLCTITINLLVQPIPTRQNFGPDQIENICRRQIKCNKNDSLCL